MGDYLALHMDLQGNSLQGEMIEPLFTNDLFLPVAIGAIDGRTSGYNWFLAGYALESFVSIFLNHPGRSSHATIEIAARQGDEEHAYLSAMANHLRRLDEPLGKPSPYETIDEITGVTYVGQRRLASSVLTTLGGWLSRYPKGEVYLYGSLKIAVQKSHELPWRHAFRFLYSTPEYRQKYIGAPFLVIHLTVDPFTGNTIFISLRSGSHVWLREAFDLNGYVAKEDADENLNNLVAIAELLSSMGNGMVEPAELHLEGSIFHDEAERIRRAFASLIA